MTDPILALTGLLPPTVVLAGGRIADLQGALWPTEAAAIARAGDSRRAAFTAGRTAARQALSRLGWPVTGLSPAADGPPDWPAGLVGSISHGGDWAFAAVARATDLAALGVDVEPAASVGEDLRPELTGPADSLTGATLTEVFVAKEAAYKALFPPYRRPLAPPEVQLTMAGGLFTATAWGQPINGRITESAGLVLGAAWLPA
jgi:4'-phosphopantetheinyl transferase EntD